MKVYSIYQSIDGEVNAWGSGRLTTFVRLFGCNLRCSYCDTMYAVDPEEGTFVNKTVSEVVDICLLASPRKVTITGGEPLLQKKEVVDFINILTFEDFKVSIETNGTLPIPEVSNRSLVSWVVDYKLPSSGCYDKMKDENFLTLTDNDFIKFVIFNKEDFKCALDFRSRMQDKIKTNWAFGPVHGKLSVDQLLNWLLEEGYGDELINVQLHKLIWPDCGEQEER